MTGALTHSPSLPAPPTPLPTPIYITPSIYIPPSNCRACTTSVLHGPLSSLCLLSISPPSHFMWHHSLSCIELYTLLSSLVHVTEPLNEEKRPLLLPCSRENANCMLNIGEKAKIDVYNHYVYIHKYYIPKKAKGKGPQ
jgi:hypothetical protein